MTACARSVCRIILHADDFGMNAAVNRGIIAAFRQGLLTSTSLLANAPHAEEACRHWRDLMSDRSERALESQALRDRLDDPSIPFDLGVHINLSQGRPITGARYPAEMLDSAGNFPGIGMAFYRMKRIGAEKLTRVEEELRAQIEWMCDRGLKPVHLNGHQYVELIPQLAARLPRIMKHYAIPVVRIARESGLASNVLLQGRIAAWGVGLVKHFYASRLRRGVRTTEFAHADQFFGTCHAGQVTLGMLTRFLNRSTQTSSTEIGLHPGEDAYHEAASRNDAWYDPLRYLRKLELDWLCGAELPRLMESRNLKLGRLQSLARPDST